MIQFTPAAVHPLRLSIVGALLGALFVSSPLNAEPIRTMGKERSLSALLDVRLEDSLLRCEGRVKRPTDFGRRRQDCDAVVPANANLQQLQQILATTTDSNGDGRMVVCVEPRTIAAGAPSLITVNRADLTLSSAVVGVPFRLRNILLRVTAAGFMLEDASMALVDSPIFQYMRLLNIDGGGLDALRRVTFFSKNEYNTGSAFDAQNATIGLMSDIAICDESVTALDQAAIRLRNSKVGALRGVHYTQSARNAPGRVLNAVDTTIGSLRAFALEHANGPHFEASQVGAVEEFTFRGLVERGLVLSEGSSVGAIEVFEARDLNMYERDISTQNFLELRGTFENPVRVDTIRGVDFELSERQNGLFARYARLGSIEAINLVRVVDGVGDIGSPLITLEGSELDLLSNVQTRGGGLTLQNTESDYAGEFPTPSQITLVEKSCTRDGGGAPILFIADDESSVAVSLPPACL